MKKLLILLAVLIVLSGVVFYFGWIQFQLPEHTYAVIFTKSGGWDEEVTEPGRFTWRWERLIPTNLTLHRYELHPHRTTFSYDGELPSGSLYAEGIEPRPDFSYSVTFSIAFALRPEALPRIAAEEGITPDLLPEYYDRVSTAVATKAAAVLNTIARDEDYGLMLASISPEIGELLLRRIAPQFPDLEMHRVLPQQIDMPDVELYQVAKEQFIAVTESRRQARIDRMSETVNTETRVNLHFQVLERYGHLLTEYPALLDLFNLKNGNLDEILNEIESLDLGETTSP